LTTTGFRCVRGLISFFNLHIQFDTMPQKDGDTRTYFTSCKA
jgi:hypothetical protein